MAISNRAERGDLIGVQENSSAADIHGLNRGHITELFEGYGYLCKPEAKVRGISGDLHTFDFVCTKRDSGEKLVIDSLLQVKGTNGAMENRICKIAVEDLRLHSRRLPCRREIIQQAAK